MSEDGKEEDPMETRVAVAAIIVSNPDSVATLNALLIEYGHYI